MKSISAALAACSLIGAQGSTVVKVGGPIQSTSYGGSAREAFKLWQTWAASADNMDAYTVEFHWQDYDSGTAAEVAKNMTDSSICNPTCVDVLVCPYGSSGSIATIGGVASSTVPILVWGGASDSIFDSACTGKKCFGFFTKGSSYLIAGIDGIKAKAGSDITVGLVANNNAFSASVAAGIKDHLASTSGMSLAIEKSLSVSKTGLTTDDEALVDDVIAATPDVVAIAGHTGDVEEVVIKIAESNYRPKAIIGTNALSSSSVYATAGKEAYMECLMMPTQWAATEDANDTLMGWTPAAFETAMGVSVSYHVASAGAAAVALAHALNAGAASDMSMLADKMSALDISTFYGPVKFNADGSIATKPMYVQQMQGTDKPIVFPTASAAAAVNYPMSDCTAWSGTTTTKYIAVNPAAIGSAPAPLVLLAAVAAILALQRA